MQPVDTVPRSAYYDGGLYATFLEPFLGRLHRKVGNLVPPGSRVLDGCCGAGGLALFLAGKCESVTGVDLSPRQIACAERRRLRRGIENVSFEVASVTDLSRFGDKVFDVATIVLGLHEMPEEERVPALLELSRVSRHVIVMDYTVPLPRSPSGLLARLVEMTAGRRHFAGFRAFLRRGGLDGLMAGAGLEPVHGEVLAGGILTLRW